MARTFRDLINQIDAVAATTVFNGPKFAAERIVRELQKAGPSWSGRFSNSWSISTPTRTIEGDGQPGEPRSIYAPIVSGRQAVRGFLAKDSVVYSITNTSPHALEAIDAVQHPRGYWKRLTPEPTTALGRSKWQESDARRQSSYRGEIGGGGQGGSSRTAPLDWFSTYTQGGSVNRAIQIEMDSALNRLAR